MIKRLTSLLLIVMLLSMLAVSCTSSNKNYDTEKESESDTVYDPDDLTVLTDYVDFVVDVPHSNKMVKSQTSKPTPAPTPTPVVNAKSHTLNRFVLPKGNSATINCVLDASISGWDKGNYIVRFRTGYPCCDGENPKDAVLEICRFGTSGSTTIKTGYLNNTRRISASTRTFSASDLMIEFSDGTDAFLVSVPRRERKGLDKLLEIARYNNRT